MTKILLVLVLCAIGPAYYLLTRDPTATGIDRNPPLAALAPTDSHGSFEIYEAVLASSLKIDLDSEGGPLRSIVPTGSGSRGFSVLDFGIRMTMKGDDVNAAEILPKQPSLIVLVRLFDLAGEPVSSDIVVAPGTDEGIKGIVRDRFGVLESTRMLPAGTTDRPTYEVSVEDGAGGWLPMRGPFIIRESDGRGFLMASAFPRDQPELRFQVTIEGEVAGELAVKNPGFPSTLSMAWTADPISWKETMGGAAVFVEKIEEKKRPGRAPLPLVHFGIEPLGDEPVEGFNLSLTGISDVMGNRASHREFDRLPGVKLLRYHGTIERSHAFPWPRSEATVIAEGVKEAGKRRIVLNPVGDGVNYGISSLTLEEQRPSSNVPKWRLRIEGEADASALPSPVFDRNSFAIFIDGGERAEGTTVEDGYGTRNSGRKVSYEYESRWIGSITDGQKVEIAIPSFLGPYDFHFTHAIE